MRSKGLRSHARLITVLAIVGLLAASLPPVSVTAQYSNQDGPLNRSEIATAIGIDERLVPVDFGQSALQVYVPATRHTMYGTMLDYWRANGSDSVYGNPISEVFAAPNGLYSQAFERGIFQYNPDWTQTDNPTVRLMPTGRQDVRERQATSRADGRRSTGDRRTSAWTPGVNQDARAAEVWGSGGRFSDATGFSIAGEFGAWYDSHEGWFYLGAPISEPMRMRGVTVQYFENTILISNGGEVSPAPLPAEHPERYGFSTEPVSQGDLPTYSESLFIDSQNPSGVDVSALPGRRRIEVSISEQKLVAYQGDQIVLETLVSTGVDPNATEVGAFHVRIKFPLKDMTGVTNGQGEVTAVGDATPTDGGGTEYLVHDVPDVMFINYQAEALHGAYWHNNFGHKMSHGCINLPLDVSAFLYDWAPLGTAVTVRE
jgi:lipoprotein-anchoring transpeptidase ErfK/SrfK